MDVEIFTKMYKIVEVGIRVCATSLTDPLFSDVIRRTFQVAPMGHSTREVPAAWMLRRGAPTDITASVAKTLKCET